MPGNIIGGRKAAATNKARYGDDWYKKIGALGGKAGNTGGFAASPEMARVAGAKGGRISRIGYKKIKQKGKRVHYLNTATGEVEIRKIK